MALISTPGPSTGSTPPMNYHVFLSFRGKDTRKNFTDHLYSALLRKGIVTFRDDEELDRGEVISVNLLKAIEESLFAIVVLSKNYASSSWCLDELQKIVESKQDLGQTVFPVFYDVDPSDIRHQKGNVGRALEEHERRFTKDKVQKWREALTEVAKLSGWDVRDKHEAKIVEDIAKYVWNKLCDELPSNFEHLVGDIQSKVERIISLLKIELDDKCFIGICGIGGIGKTTIAQVVHDAIQRKFDYNCFLYNVREDSERFGSVYLQMKLLFGLGLKEQKIMNPYDGVKVIRKYLCNKKVFIVLDDVNDEHQLDDLAINKKWLGAGSKVIITTRDINLLGLYEQFERYDVEVLDPNESLKLLSQKAFTKDKPKQGYSDLANEVVKYACGLPLALEVLGSFLRNKNQFEWRDALDKYLKQDLHHDIFGPLRLSYDGLQDEEYKAIFLDIACFFNKEAKVKVIDILKLCGLHPIIGIEVLVNKSLLSGPKYQDKYDWLQKMRRDIFLPLSMYETLLQLILKDSLYMHDLLQEMGRNIVLQESPNDAGRRSRLWSLKEIDFVLKRNKGTKKVHSIIVLDIEPTRPQKVNVSKGTKKFQVTFLNMVQYFEATWHPDCFLKMHNLRLLDLSQVRLSHSLNSLPRGLKVLRWDFYAMESLPPLSQLYELESLQLRYSKIRKLWNGTPSLHKLKIIDLNGSEDLIETPNFSGTPNLEKMFFTCCKNLVWVHESLGQLKKLVELRLDCCRNLVTLPSYLEMNKLEVFILCGCLKLEKLPEFGKNMKSLFFIGVRDTAIIDVPLSIVHLTNLKYFDVGYCSRLKSIPSKLPPNLIMVANDCFLEPKSALQHLFASCHPSVLRSPTHLLYEDIYRINFYGIPSWFERREHCRTSGTSGEFVTITANIPDVADYEGEGWGIAVCLLFQCVISRRPIWNGFSINWKFEDYCHTDQRRGTEISKESGFIFRLYIGYYPFDKKGVRRHPSGVGSQVDLTLSIPRTNDGWTELHDFNNFEIVDCGWRLVCKKDFESGLPGGGASLPPVTRECSHVLSFSSCRQSRSQSSLHCRQSQEMEKWRVRHSNRKIF